MCYMYVYLNFVLILNQCLNFVLVYCFCCIYYLWKHFFVTLAAYWSPFVTNMFTEFKNLFFVVVVININSNHPFSIKKVLLDIISNRLLELF